MINLNEVPLEKLRLGDLVQSYLMDFGAITNIIPHTMGKQGRAVIGWHDGTNSDLAHNETSNLKWIGHIDTTR